MATLCIDNTIKKTRKGLSTIYYPGHLALESILDALAADGEVIKASKKARVRRVGDFIIKESSFAGGGGPLKHTFQRSRYRRAWFSAHHLQKNGVLVPEPVAFVERGGLGLITGNAMISGFLTGQRNVEEFLRVLIVQKAGPDTIHSFLGGLAHAINQFSACGAHHGDLSGKNVFTAEGRRFTFIDLDDVTLETEIDEEKTLKNHVQLYDSFCDVLSDSIMVPFMEKLLPPGADMRVWMPRVRSAQKARREAVEERWNREGKTGSAG
ncbi:MAG: lipopolysaccharide kinase InaA family protein [Candidatus Hydrogenedentes bacterium]|nr:lipopolysaccharide kinase InaA family protein [Candidatus Hydrogenedentota bacterium]